MISMSTLISQKKKKGFFDSIGSFFEETGKKIEDTVKHIEVTINDAKIGEKFKIAGEKTKQAFESAGDKIVEKTNEIIKSEFVQSIKQNTELGLNNFVDGTKKLFVKEEPKVEDNSQFTYPNNLHFNQNSSYNNVQENNNPNPYPNSNQNSIFKSNAPDNDIVIENYNKTNSDNGKLNNTHK